MTEDNNTQPEAAPADGTANETTGKSGGPGGPRALVARIGATPRSRRGAAAAIGVLVLAVGIVVGGVVGSASTQRAADVREAALASHADALASSSASVEHDLWTTTAKVKAAQDAAAAADAARASLQARESAVAAREAAVSATEQKIAANTITEGTWVVGTDIEPGIYRTKDSVTGTCYWAILRSGTNGGDIVENDIVKGGYPQVTLSAGQDFKTSRCGSWVKQ